MTTKYSPQKVILAQATGIAQMLVKFERGEPIDVAFAEKLRAARDKDTVTIGIAMDDKFIKIDISWAKIRESGKVALTEYIFDLMRETRKKIN